jgi:hypothetical protein
VRPTSRALAAQRGVIPIDRLVAALVPIYYGRVAGLVVATRDMTTETAEAVVERQAAAFERMKPAFAAAWVALATEPSQGIDRQPEDIRPPTADRRSGRSRPGGAA